MLFSITYLVLFLAAGLGLARRAVPDGASAVVLPLGCGFGISLLAALPAAFALVCGFTLRAVLLGGAGAALPKTLTAARCGFAYCRCWP